MNRKENILHDIGCRSDIETVLVAFYQRAFKDDLIGRFFTEVISLDLSGHLPLIADFWDSVLFGNGEYRKNVMAVHQHIHSLSQIKKDHLNRWVELFTQTVNELFSGEKATIMKQRAVSVATLMNIKLNHDSNNK